MPAALTGLLLVVSGAPAHAVTFGAGVVIVEPSQGTYTIPPGEFTASVPQKSNHSWNATGDPNQILNLAWLITLTITNLGRVDSKGADPDVVQLNQQGTFNSGVLTLQGSANFLAGPYTTNADTEVHDNSAARAYVDASKNWSVQF